MDGLKQVCDDIGSLEEMIDVERYLENIRNIL
jgi:hypothetical protein